MKDLKRFETIGDPNAGNYAFTWSYPLLPLDSKGLRVLLRLGFAEEAKRYSASLARPRTLWVDSLPKGYLALIAA